jgi:hypothetical protein
MSTTARRIVGAALAVAVTLATVALSRVPYGDLDPDISVLRLTWRAPGEAIEDCRLLSPEEIEAQPVHMRRDRICERRLVPYRLSVYVDGVRVVDETVRPAGAREDRPLFVFRELTLEPGEHQVAVNWVRETGPDPLPADSPAIRGGLRGTGPLSLDATLDLAAGDVALVTYDPDRRSLATAGRGIVRSTSRTSGIPGHHQPTSERETPP